MVGVVALGALVAAVSPASVAAQGTATRPQGASRPAGASAAVAVTAPRFTVDLMWPKPLPANKLLGSVTGVAVDAHDHVFVVHRIDSFTARTETGADANPPIAECCLSELPVIQFDATGNRIKSWGGPGPGYDWPAIPSGIAVAPNGDVWIAGTGGMDGQVLVFSHDGAFKRQIGRAGRTAAPAGAQPQDTAYQGVSPGARGAAPPAAAAGAGAAGGRGGAGGGRGGRGGPPPSLPPNSSATDILGGATRIAFDAAGTTAYIADGTRNRRVVTVDVATGAVKAFWGAYGKSPSDAATPAYSPSASPSQSFSTVSCARPAKDGKVYVCDRANNRIQVFTAAGEFVSEATIAPNTLGEGAVWDIAFSADAAQRFMYVADGGNHKVRILDRATMKELTNFGDGGRQAGAFYAPGSIAVDSRGNVITGETYQGKRIQKFNFGGLGTVTKANQGLLWPTTTTGAGR
ncbi:MAG: hypothetical protein FJ202_05155 [Gemmatimonadetes bacterium]|nr:hypothetical protein [Gemmatimonadota bacterium]